jgi:hypothetical protein
VFYEAAACSGPGAGAKSEREYDAALLQHARDLLTEAEHALEPEGDEGQEDREMEQKWRAHLKAEAWAELPDAQHEQQQEQHQHCQEKMKGPEVGAQQMDQQQAASHRRGFVASSDGRQAVREQLAGMRRKAALKSEILANLL